MATVTWPTGQSEQAKNPDQPANRPTGTGNRATVSRRQPGTGNPERATRNGQPGTGNPERATRNGQPGTGNPERATRNGQPGTGNPERATGPRSTVNTVNRPTGNRATGNRGGLTVPRLSPVTAQLPGQRTLITVTLSCIHYSLTLITVKITMVILSSIHNKDYYWYYYYYYYCCYCW